MKKIIFGFIFVPSLLWGGVQIQNTTGIPPTSGNCGVWGSNYTLNDAGAPCGSGSGSGPSGQIIASPQFQIGQFSVAGTSNVITGISSNTWIYNQSTLQSGATFYVSSGTVSGQLNLNNVVINGTCTGSGCGGSVVLLSSAVSFGSTGNTVAGDTNTFAWNDSTFELTVGSNNISGLGGGIRSYAYTSNTNPLMSLEPLNTSYNPFESYIYNAAGGGTPGGASAYAFIVTHDNTDTVTFKASQGGGNGTYKFNGTSGNNYVTISNTAETFAQPSTFSSSVTIAGSGGLGVTYEVTAGSLTLTGSGWPNFTPFDGNIYNLLGTSTTPVAVGDFMAYASTSGSVQDIGSTIPASKIGAGALGAGVIASSLTASGVTAGSYTNTNLTVNAEGQVTSASNGSGGSFQGVGISANPLLTSSATLVAGTNVTLSQTGSSITINSGGGTTLSHVGWCDPQTCAINVNNTVSLSSGIPHCVGFFAPGGSNTVVVSTVSFWIDAATSTAIGFYTSAGNLISQSNMTSASNDISILQMSPPVSLSGGSYYYICSAVPANRGQQDSYLDQYTYVNYAMNAGSDASNCQAFDAANHATFTTVSVLPATLGAVRTCGTTIGGNGVNAGTRPYYQFY